MSRTIRCGYLVAGILIVLLAASGCAPTVIWQGRSPDHRHYAEIRTDGERQLVRLDGVKGDSYQGIADRGILFSPDGNHLAYPALHRDHWIMVKDGKPGPAWDGIDDPVFSPDGKRLAYAAQRGSAWYVVHDGHVSSPFDSLLSGSLLFSPDSERLAFAAWTDDAIHLVENDESGPSFVGIGDMQFSAGNSRFLYLGYRKTEVCLVVDGEVRFCEQDLKHPAMNSDGSRVAVAVRDSAGWHLRENQRRGPAHLDIKSVRFEPDRGRLAYVAVSPGGQQLVIDGIPGPLWGEVDGPVYPEQGGKWGYLAADADSQVVVVDGEILGRHFWVSDLVFNRDGSDLAYLAEKNGGAAIIQGDQPAEFPLILGGSLVFSADGVHLGCLAGDPAEKLLFLVVDGQPTDRFFTWGEYTSALARKVEGHAREETSSCLLRNWVKAEMELYLEIGK